MVAAEELEDRPPGSFYKADGKLREMERDVVKRWKKPLCLKDRLEIPPEWESFVSDYKINLFEIAYLTKEQGNYFGAILELWRITLYRKDKRGTMCQVPAESTMYRKRCNCLAL